MTLLMDQNFLSFLRIHFKIPQNSHAVIFSSTQHVGMNGYVTFLEKFRISLEKKRFDDGKTISVT